MQEFDNFSVPYHRVERKVYTVSDYKSTNNMPLAQILATVTAGIDGVRIELRSMDCKDGWEVVYVSIQSPEAIMGGVIPHVTRELEYRMQHAFGEVKCRCGKTCEK